MTRATWRRGKLFLAMAVFAACTPKPEWPDSGTPVVEPPKDSGPPKDCRDVDGDGYPGTGDCSDVPAGQLDCNDNDTTIYPGAPETCNGVDDNCNFSIDEGLPIKNYGSSSVYGMTRGESRDPPRSDRCYPARC